MKDGLFLSIDFEDFSHDLKHSLGLWRTGPVRVDALWRCYDGMSAFLDRHGEARATFFCTGIVAEQAPDLIAKIASDGHKVACHYHYHDDMDRQSVADVATLAARAKTVLEEASGTEVIGFRAPKFRIEKENPEQYRAIAELFRYDSSWFGENLADAREFLSRMGVDGLRLFPIYAGRVATGLPPLRLGGTYLKLFPRFVADRLVTGCQAASLIPHIYLHPYEFTSEGEFRLSREELTDLGFRKATYWRLRQHQWNTVGNAGLENKLSAIVGRRRLLGRLRDHMELAV